MSSKSKRLVIRDIEPNAYEVMYGFEKYLAKTNLEPSLKELIKIRVSQINGCAFCINLHTKDARTMGETEQRIYALSAWRETPFFSEIERAVLALAEEITYIQKGVSDQTYQNVAKLMEMKTLAQTIMAIIAINAWNRIAITTHQQPALD